jgi:hypothetical protein
MASGLPPPGASGCIRTIPSARNVVCRPRGNGFGRTILTPDVQLPAFELSSEKPFRVHVGGAVHSISDAVGGLFAGRWQFRVSVPAVTEGHVSEVKLFGR